MNLSGIFFINVDEQTGHESFLNLFIYLFFFSIFSLEPVVWEIAALVRTESSLLTTDTLAVILVAGITTFLIVPSSSSALLKRTHTFHDLRIHSDIAEL